MVKTKYTIVWHFEGTTLTSTYEDEETRDKGFDQLCKMLEEGTKFLRLGDMVLNASQVLAITKGEGDEWNCQKYH